MTTKKKAVSSSAAAPAPRTKVDNTTEEPVSPAKLQIQIFEEALRLFTQRNFVEAQARFETAMKGPAAHVTDKARSYAQVCARKLSAADVNPQTAEDFFNYGVERLNARDVAQARAQFARALALQPDAEHIHYTLALACGLSGDGDGAYENLKRAIELEPKNRILARQDPEFSALASQFPPLRTLLQGESHGPF